VREKIFVGVTSFVLIALLLVAYFKGEPGFSINNLVPELIGVCIEFIIIVLAFNLWQKKEEKDNNIKVERRLREFLIFFLKNNFQDFPLSCQPGRFYGKDHTNNQKCLNDLIAHIESNGLTEGFKSGVQTYCNNEKEIFNNLIPVASQITNNHFKSWVRIAYFMNSISFGSKSKGIDHDVIKILQHIKEFDNASFQSNLYVGAV
jgi:hypothetical protein|tara:strand:- start:95 stop:706 length:612 start_codon:yes stop_codon:yes gene_type:complete